jgi:hypothetical protein
VLYDESKGEIFSFEHEGHGFVAIQQVVDFYGATKETTFAPVIVRGESPASSSSTSLALNASERSNNAVILETPHSIWSSWAVSLYTHKFISRTLKYSITA